MGACRGSSSNPHAGGSPRRWPHALVTIGDDDRMVAYNCLTTVGFFGAGVPLLRTAIDVDGSPSSGAEEEERCRPLVKGVQRRRRSGGLTADERPPPRVITSPRPQRSTSALPKKETPVLEFEDRRQNSSQRLPSAARMLSENSEFEDNDASNWGTPDPSSLCVDSELVRPSALLRHSPRSSGSAADSPTRELRASVR